MPEIPDVVQGELIESQWGNLIRSRTIQRYESATDRTTRNPNPQVGDMSYLSDSHIVERWNGTEWGPISGGAYLPSAGGTLTGDLTVQGGSPRVWWFNTTAGGAMKVEMRDNGELVISNQSNQDLLSIGGPSAGTVAKFRNLPQNEPVNVGLVNNWEAFFMTPQTVKTPDGMVHLNGGARNGDTIHIGNITADHRPTQDQLIETSQSGTGINRYLQASPDGRIRIGDGLGVTADWFLMRASWFVGWGSAP